MRGNFLATTDKFALCEQAIQDRARR